MAKNNTKEYVLLFRGGANPEDMSPEQMQATMNNWMSWMKGLRKRKQLGAGHPLQDSGKKLSGLKGKNVAPFKETPDSIGGFMLSKRPDLRRPPRFPRVARSLTTAERWNCAPSR